MANLLEVGVEFESFDAFQAAMEQYEDNHFVQFSRIDSRSVERAQEVTPTKIYNPAIQFVQLTYACTFGPRKVASKSSGIRNASSRKIDCPVRLRISSTPDGQRLVVRESKLDGHNHELSEELYKSMARQKQLDEETEVEIYNLISNHNDKRLARMLVRKRLTQETGRSMSIKDILNIEKKIARRIEREKISESDSGTNADNKEESSEQKNGEEAILEATDRNANQTGDAAKVFDSTEYSEEKDKNQESQEEEVHRQEEEQEEEEEEEENTTNTRSDTDNEKIPPLKRVKKEPNPMQSQRRPQRHRREPSRFRDALTNGTKVLHTSQDKVVSILSPEEVEDMIVTDTPSRSAAKVKEEVGVRGRKRKQEEKKVLQSDLDTEAEEEYRRRKLAFQEELLDMERKKMTVLNSIVEKLDLIIQNQNRTSHENK